MNNTVSKTVLGGVTALAMTIVPVSGTLPGAQPPLLGDVQDIQGMLTSSSAGALLPIASAQLPRVTQTFNVLVTAYSSTPDQTDDTPFITASGTHVRNGIVAANFLPMGTKIQMPEVYGNRIFVVEDRMHPRKAWMVDVWFPSLAEAKTFGVKDTYIQVLEN